MLDMLVLRLPVLDAFVHRVGEIYTIKGDVADYGLKAGTRYISKDIDTGKVTHGELYHPFEALPSSYSNMAIKFYHLSRNCKPYMMIKASPAKLLQGHNICGGNSIYNGACEMLTLLQDAYPLFYLCLDIYNIDVRQLDCTFSARLPHERLVQPVLRFLSKVENGYLKNDTQRRDFYNTVYFGGATTRYHMQKVYGKYHEVMETIKELRKKADKGCIDSAWRLSAFSNEILNFSKCLLRLEQSIKARKLEDLSIPLNLWQLIDYQHEHPNLVADLWQIGFKPILQTLKGEDMDYTDDGVILDKCCSELRDYTKSGNVTYTKANNAYHFYLLIKQDGYFNVKSRMTRRSFNRKVSQLVSIGIPKAVLQNLHESRGKVIPMVELVKVDFSQQYPEGYEPPVSKHFGKFDTYLINKRPNLKLVA